MSGIEGYASLFGVADRSGDVIAPGAFRRTLARRRAGALPLLYQHRTDEVLGRVVHITEDRRGLFVRAALECGVARAREALALMRSRTLTGLSIGFRPVRARPLRHARRLLTEIELWEISLVTFPMLDGARVTRVVADRQAIAQVSGIIPARPGRRAGIQSTRTKAWLTKEVRPATLRIGLKGLGPCFRRDERN